MARILEVLPSPQPHLALMYHHPFMVVMIHLIRAFGPAIRATSLSPGTLSYTYHRMVNEPVGVTNEDNYRHSLLQ